jgi:hypothetical protein
MKLALSSLLGVSLAVVGIAIPAQSQSVTLSGDSLRTVENRSINDDYLYFYSGGEAVEANIDFQDEASSASIPTSDLAGEQVSVFGEDLNIVFGNIYQHPPYFNLVNMSAVDNRETQQVQVLFPLDE